VKYFFSPAISTYYYGKEVFYMVAKEQATERITYRQGISMAEASGYVKAISLPIIVFMTALVCISKFGAFGRNIMAPAVSIMWILGVATAWKIPSQRRSTLTETYVTIAGYVLALSLLRFLIGIAATTSSEQLMATYSQALPVSAGASFSGFLQSMLWVTALVTPFTACCVMAKKFISFRRTISKDKILQQIRGLRK